MKLNLKTRWKRLGKLDKVFVFGLLLYLLLLLIVPSSGFVTILQFVLSILGIWIVLRISRVALRKAIWRLRNRLIVAYLLIAVVPILLIITLAGLGAYTLAAQLAVYLVRSELDRRIASMQNIAETLLRTQPNVRAEMTRRTGEIYRERLPGLELLVSDHGSVQRWPPDAALKMPADVEGNLSGIATVEKHYFGWAHVGIGGVQVVAAAPLTRRYLSDLVPGLGDVYFWLGIPAKGSKQNPQKNGDRKVDVLLPDHEIASNALPPPVNRFDLDFGWPSVIHVSDGMDTAATKPGALLVVHTRLSAVLEVIQSQKLDEFQGFWPFILLAIAIAFLLVELVSLIIGVTLTRTITGAVHSLYVGTQRVMQSDFTHRIKVSGRDQLADLSTSFNTMTENLERLLAVAKEKERLQAEIEIARQVQEQLYPKTAPVLRTLQVIGRCQPARMVSGDYFDYQSFGTNKLAMAIGDVAGKGISAALLMASIQSAMRMELRSLTDTATPTGMLVNGHNLSTARMVSDLNRQLYATTSPEKFATFCFALYDEDTGVVTYTNAGHLPPILIRNGAATMLEINGTVVGAFPASRYDESTVQLESGDLLLCYTDGITEPENEYGEMFGEERLIELVTKNSDRDDDAIINVILEAVHQWIGDEEQPDDMTILLARRK